MNLFELGLRVIGNHVWMSFLVTIICLIVVAIIPYDNQHKKKIFQYMTVVGWLLTWIPAYQRTTKAIEMNAKIAELVKKQSEAK